jgi:preprotein translocase subunit YajC
MFYNTDQYPLPLSLWSLLLFYFYVFYVCFVPQEKKLMEEIKRLNDEIHGCDKNIKSGRINITTLESQIAKSYEGFNDYKANRGELHRERKFVYFVFFCDVFMFFFWMKKESLNRSKLEYNKSVG